MSNMEGGPCAASLSVPPRLAFSWSTAFRKNGWPVAVGDVWAAAGVTAIRGVGVHAGPNAKLRTRMTTPTRPRIPDAPESHRCMSHLQPGVMKRSCPDGRYPRGLRGLSRLDDLRLLVDREEAVAERALVLVDRAREGRGGQGNAHGHRGQPRLHGRRACDDT